MNEEVMKAMLTAIKSIDASINFETETYDRLMASYASKKEAYEDVIREHVCLITDLNKVAGKSPYGLIALDHDRRIVDIPDYERNIVTDANGIGRMEVTDGGVRIYYDDTYKSYYKSTNDMFEGTFVSRMEIAGFYDPANPLNEE